MLRLRNSSSLIKTTYNLRAIISAWNIESTRNTFHPFHQIRNCKHYRMIHTTGPKNSNEAIVISTSPSSNIMDLKDVSISVIGSGSFGSAVARILGQVQEQTNERYGIDTNVTMYARRTSVADEINSKRTNAQYLPVVNDSNNTAIPTFSNTLSATSDLVEAVSNKSVIVIAVPSAFLSRMLEQMKPHVHEDAIFVSLVKSLHYDKKSKRMRTTVDDIRTHVSLTVNKFGSSFMFDLYCKFTEKAHLL